MREKCTDIIELKLVRVRLLCDFRNKFRVNSIFSDSTESEFVSKHSTKISSEIQCTAIEKQKKKILEKTILRMPNKNSENSQLFSLHVFVSGTQRVGDDKCICDDSERKENLCNDGTGKEE